MPFEMKKKMEGSPQQKAIWKQMQTGTSHLIIEARAGTGKTTTIVEGLSRLYTKRGGFVAFNKSVAKELRSKVPRSCKACTTHSLGLNLVTSSFEDVEVEKDKFGMIVDDIQADFGMYERYHWRKGQQVALKKLVEHLKGRGLVIDPNDSDEMTKIKLTEDMDEIIDHHGLDFRGREPKFRLMAARILQESLRWFMERMGKADTRCVDFDDMLWLPFQLGLNEADRFDTLLVDEAQDLNVCQRELVLRNAERLIVVGDRYQSIYAFRGADSESIPEFIRELEDTERGVEIMPLTVSWRCPLVGIEWARKLVSDIDPREDAEQGIVFSDVTEDELFSGRDGDPACELCEGTGVMRYDEKTTGTCKSCCPPVGPAHDFFPVDAGDMVLCRTNAPLVRLLYRMWAKRIKAFIQGRKVGEGIEKLVERFSRDKEEGDSIELVISEVSIWQSEREAAWQGKEDGRRKIAQLADQVECLMLIAEDVGTIGEMKSKLRQIFQDRDDPGKAVRLSSIHRAKGLEADRVWLLEPETIPHPMSNRDWELQQEKNLAYVAVTRFKKQFMCLGQMPPAFLLEGMEYEPARFDVERWAEHELEKPSPFEELQRRIDE